MFSDSYFCSDYSHIFLCALLVRVNQRHEKFYSSTSTSWCRRGLKRVPRSDLYKGFRAVIYIKQFSAHFYKLVLVL